MNTLHKNLKFLVFMSEPNVIPPNPNLGPISLHRPCYGDVTAKLYPSTVVLMFRYSILGHRIHRFSNHIGLNRILININ